MLLTVAPLVCVAKYSTTKTPERTHADRQTTWYIEAQQRTRCWAWKFLKDPNNQAEIVLERDNDASEKIFNDRIQCAKKENLELKEKLNGNIRDNEMLRYDIEELETKNQNLESEKGDL